MNNAAELVFSSAAFSQRFIRAVCALFFCISYKRGGSASLRVWPTEVPKAAGSSAGTPSVLLLHPRVKRFRQFPCVPERHDSSVAAGAFKYHRG